jgi:hypothetical protein
MSIQPSAVPDFPASDGVQTALVPNTLNLVDRALLGINGLIGTTDPGMDYEPYFLSFIASKPPYMAHWSSLVSGVFPKYLEALALLRCMTGSDYLREQERGLVDAILRNIDQDGLIYDRKSPKRPWNVGVWYGKNAPDEDFTCLAGDGRLVCGMDFYGQLTGDESWKQRMVRASQRMMELAIVKEDYAYYPNVNTGNDCSWPRDRGWPHTNEPGGPREGQEGALAFYQALPIRGWTRCYKYTGDERLLDMSRRFARFVMKPKFWGGKHEGESAFGKRRAHWYGHFHGTLAAFRGVLEYAMVAQDYRALEFVRDGYEWARQHFCPQLGCDAMTEGCAFGDIAALAIQLSDAGAGDFWDDADCLVRNALLEAQYTDADGLKALGEAAIGKFKHWGNEVPLPGQEDFERVVERNIGAIAFMSQAALVQDPIMMSCCTANANQAFYYAWEAIVRHEDGRATVNLLLNRFSPWLDIVSYLPYEGKVVINNKTARQINVRVPAWVPQRAVVCTVNGQPMSPQWLGRYAKFDELRGGEMLMLTFPLRTETVHLELSTINSAGGGGGDISLLTEFRGSTCLGTQAMSEDYRPQRVGLQMYRRTHYRQEKAPMRRIPYNIVQRPIRWY